MYFSSIHLGKSFSLLHVVGITVDAEVDASGETLYISIDFSKLDLSLHLLGDSGKVRSRSSNDLNFDRYL